MHILKVSDLWTYLKIYACFRLYVITNLDNMALHGQSWGENVRLTFTLNMYMNISYIRIYIFSNINDNIYKKNVRLMCSLNMYMNIFSLKMLMYSNINKKIFVNHNQASEHIQIFE